jgi:hypothetical protein
MSSALTREITVNVTRTYMHQTKKAVTGKEIGAYIKAFIHKTPEWILGQKDCQYFASEL